MMNLPLPCTRTGLDCGTTTGWRKGGRCPDCRAAHNADTNRRRGIGKPSDTDRRIILARLRQGDTPEQAAAAVGRTPLSINRAASTDSELRLALNGAPLEAQRAARMGDYLAALTRHNGAQNKAAAETNTSSMMAGWRRNPDFAAAEQAVIRLSQYAKIPGRNRVSYDMLDRAADVLAAGGTLTEAARAIGVTPQTLRNGGTRLPRLAALLPPERRSPRRKRTPQHDELLRQLWDDPSVTVADICERLDVHPMTVRAWATDLGLPNRRGVARRRRHQREQAARESEGRIDAAATAGPCP